MVSALQPCRTGDDGAASKLLSLRIDELLYLAASFLYILQGFLDTTMFAYILPTATISLLKGAALMLVIVKVILTDIGYRLGRMFTVLLLGIAGILSFFYSGYSTPLFFIIMVVGATDVNFDKIAKLYLLTSTMLTIITVAAALSGVIQNVAIPRQDGIYYSYGFYYITEFSAHALYISLAWLYVKRNSLSWKIYLSTIIWTAVVFAMTNGKLAFYLTLFTVASVAITETLKRVSTAPQALRFPSVLRLSFLFMATLSIVLMVTYNESSMMQSLGSALQGRLRYAHLGYLQYGVSAFGQQIEMQGWGGGQVVWAENYFYIDCSYINILLRFGYVTLTVVCLICSIPFFRMKRSSTVIAYILVAVAIASFINEHLMGLQYNVFALMAFAECSDLCSIKGFRARLTPNMQRRRSL